MVGKSKPTVKTRKDTDQLLALDIDGEFYYPVFQFTDEEGSRTKACSGCGRTADYAEQLQ